MDRREIVLLHGSLSDVQYRLESSRKGPSEIGRDAFERVGG